MVVPLGPGKFYGSSLPRPRIYTDVKFNDERVDPPVPVLDPLLSWANEAHWSMGGLSFKRLRLQGRIEGSVSKLRAEREKLIKKQARMPISPNGSDPIRSKRSVLDSPPPAPIATKRKRFMALFDDDEEDEEEVEEEEVVVKRRLVKKLGDDFDRVAMEAEIKKVGPVKDSGHASGSGSGPMRTRSRGAEEVVELVNKLKSKGKKVKSSSGSGGTSGGVRTSPRLANRGPR